MTDSREAVGRPNLWSKGSRLARTFLLRRCIPDQTAPEPCHTNVLRYIGCNSRNRLTLRPG